MKKAISFRSLTLLIISIVLITNAYSQSFIAVRGTGPVVDKKINVSDFKSVDVSGGIDVILVQGSSESLTISAQENILEYIKADVDYGTLRISVRGNIRPTQPMKARITFRNIKDLKVSGGGDIHSETPVNTEDLDVAISGGGDFSSEINSEKLRFSIVGGGDAEISGKTKDYDISVSGGGDLKSMINAGMTFCRIVGGGDLYLRNETQGSQADIDISGGGDAEIKINAEKLKCSLGGGGDALLSGYASFFDINIGGGGDADARSLSTEVATFNVRGGSDIHINSSKELSGYISGGGDLYYSGNPVKLSVEARGGSETHKE